MEEPAEKRVKMPITLGYWKIRGLAQPIRLLLKYAGIEFDNVMYEQGDGPEYSFEEWKSVKFTLGLDFPNLPYLIDGDIKISQTNAILRYIARKADLCGKTEKEMAIVDMMASEIMDMRNAFVGLLYGKEDYNNIKDAYITKVKTRCEKISKFLGDKKWLAGDEITFPDFHLYEMLDQHCLFQPGILDEFPSLKAYKQRFEALPAIKAYMESDEFMKAPVNNKICQWNP